jgi:hypothetical protein
MGSVELGIGGEMGRVMSLKNIYDCDEDTIESGTGWMMMRSIQLDAAHGSGIVRDKGGKELRAAGDVSE